MNNYFATDIQLHILSQLIAKTNRTFLQKKEDDSHTNLHFDALENRICGRWIGTGNEKKMLSFSLNELQFQWLDSKLQVLQSVAVLNKTFTQIEEEIQEGLSALSLSQNGFSKPMHYEIPTYESINEPFKEFHKEGLSQWIFFRHLANEACYLLTGHLQLEEPPRIWPHHFDTGIYVKPKPSVGIGFGLAMKDAMVGDAYFYLSGYKLDGSKFEFENLPKLNSGKWHISENWNGVVLPLADLKEEASQKLYHFLRETTHWYLNN